MEGNINIRGTVEGWSDLVGKVDTAFASERLWIRDTQTFKGTSSRFQAFAGSLAVRGGFGSRVQILHSVTTWFRRTWTTLQVTVARTKIFSCLFACDWSLCTHQYYHAHHHNHACNLHAGHICFNLKLLINWWLKLLQGVGLYRRS